MSDFPSELHTKTTAKTVHKHRSICGILADNNNNNNNIPDNVYGAVIMAEPLREFTRFI